MHPWITEQIKSIYAYITNHLLNEPASWRLRSTVEQKLSHISTFPKTGTLISTYINDILNEFSSLRKINANNYTILYSYEEEIDIVYVTHIFHQTQNYAKVFQK